MQQLVTLSTRLPKVGKMVHWHHFHSRHQHEHPHEHPHPLFTSHGLNTTLIELSWAELNWTELILLSSASHWDSRILCRNSMDIHVTQNINFPPPLHVLRVAQEEHFLWFALQTFRRATKSAWFTDMVCMSRLHLQKKTDRFQAPLPLISCQK